MGKYSGRSPYIFFTLVPKVCFLPRFKQRWCFKMGPLCSLSLVCTEYLMHKNNTNGVKLEYQIHIINLNKYFYGNTEFSPFGCHFLLRITGFRAFASGCSSLKCSFFGYSADVLWLVALGSMFSAVNSFMNGFSTMFSINSVTRG